jgi:hypothetical protein
MKLRFNPLQVFKTSKTPAGLYARQKWMGESNTGRWEKDFKATVDILLKNQGKDGSWKESEVETINRLSGITPAKKMGLYSKSILLSKDNFFFIIN